MPERPEPASLSLVLRTAFVTAVLTVCLVAVYGGPAMHAFVDWAREMGAR